MINSKEIEKNNNGVDETIKEINIIIICYWGKSTSILFWYLFLGIKNHFSKLYQPSVKLWIDLSASAFPILTICWCLFSSLWLHSQHYFWGILSNGSWTHSVGEIPIKWEQGLRGFNGICNVLKYAWPKATLYMALRLKQIT